MRPAVTGGILEIDGPYQQTAGGTVATAIDGTTPGNGFGQLKVTEAATLAGRIDVTPAAGYSPPVGHRFSVLAYACHAGQLSDDAGADPYRLTYSASQADVAFSGG